MRCRAYLAAGRAADAVTELEGMLAAWKDADADLPALRQAKAEYAKLG